MEGRYIPEEIPAAFWAEIEACAGDADAFAPRAAAMTAEELLHFGWNYEEAVAQIKPFYYDLSSFSEDSIDELCLWIVARGPQAYQHFWDEAEDLIADPNSPYGQLQGDPGIMSVVNRIYREKTGNDLPIKRDERFYP